MDGDDEDSDGSGVWKRKRGDDQVSSRRRREEGQRSERTSDSSSRKHFLKVESHGLGSDEFGSSSSDGHFDEGRDERKIQDAARKGRDQRETRVSFRLLLAPRKGHRVGGGKAKDSLGKSLDHRNDGDLDGGNSHKSEGDVSNERSLGDELKPQSNGSNERFNLNPKRDRDLQPVESSDEELDQEMDVLASKFVGLSGLSSVREGDLQVLFEHEEKSAQLGSDRSKRT